MQEGKAKIITHEGIISKKLPVFYNPIMKLNRDVSLALLSSIDKQELTIGDPLAGSGIRAIRFLLELPSKKIKEISVNDLNNQATKEIEENLNNNCSKAKQKKVIISNEDANLFLLKNKFDYVDIDPFGPPTPFLENAVRATKRKGILAVTATDTGALSGTFINACKRKYWATPKKTSLMHETGLRILIRRVQLAGMTFDKALIPILSYSKDHYMRVFFLVEIGKQKCDALLKQHQLFNEMGPLWVGKLWDTKVLKKAKEAGFADEFLEELYEESKIDSIGFFEMHQISRELKISPPKFDDVIKKIESAGFSVARTHFSPIGLKSDIPKEKLAELLKKKN